MRQPIAGSLLIAGVVVFGSAQAGLAVGLAASPSQVVGVAGLVIVAIVIVQVAASGVMQR